jgi:hypothetical protein
MANSETDTLAQVAGAVVAGAIRVPIMRTYRLDDVPQGCAGLQSRGEVCRRRRAGGLDGGWSGPGRRVTELGYRRCTVVFREPLAKSITYRARAWTGSCDLARPACVRPQGLEP